MQLLIYNIISSLYFLTIRAASLFDKKAEKWTAGRKGIFYKLESGLKPDERRIWFHCASLGEFEQGRPVMEALKANDPEIKIVLTFFSPSGYEIRKNYSGADYTWYLPPDSAENAKRFIELVNPESAFFVKYEFWYHYIAALKKKNVPLYLVSGIFRERQVFFRWYGTLFRKALMSFTHLFVQNDKSLQLLTGIGITNVSVSGDTRYDRVTQIAGTAKEIPLAEKFKDGKKTIVCGSTWAEDESVLLPFLNGSSGIKFIIAPHETGEGRIRELVSKLKKKAIRYSKADETSVSDYEVLVIDNIGMLSSLYRYGEVAYVGGAFTKGLHNILEAAVYGLPVLFGPRYGRFPEAAELIEAGGALSVRNSAELSAHLKNLLSDGNFLKAKSETSKKFVVNRTGAVLKIMKKIINT